MFRSLVTIIRELVLHLAKVIFMLKLSVKLRRYILVLCVDVAGCCHINTQFIITFPFMYLRFVPDNIQNKRPKHVVGK